MVVLCSLINIEVFQKTAAERTFREHTLNSMTDNLVNTVLASTKLGWSIETLSAWIASITCVNLIGFLFAGEIYLAGIDDDYVVTAIYVRSEVWLVFTAQQLSNL